MNTLSLFLVVFLVLILTILTGSLDPLILAVAEKLIGDVSSRGVKDVRMIFVLIAFAVSFLGMVLTALEKRSNQLLLAASVATVFFFYLGELVKASGDEVPDYKALYMALALFIALMLPMVLTGGADRARQLRHAYATFSLSLCVSIPVGLLFLGIGKLLWPASALLEAAGTSRYVITPMAAVIVTVCWGLMSTYRLIPDWIHPEERNSWQATYLVFALVLSFLYGWIFLASKSWVINAGLSEWQAGFIAQVLLLPGIMVFGAWLKLLKRPIGWLDWAALVMLCSVLQGAIAFLVATRLEIGADDRFYPFDQARDRLPFVAIHTLASGVSILSIALVLRFMKSYPWARWHQFAQIIK